ncbi:MAG TPA: trypsin-like peptidase domain-containing protein [Acidobacteriaceae bacterium]|nr:trypsin-like peptidase domain-containing protein [Acidobacteriaceae bacterium]
MEASTQNTGVWSGLSKQIAETIEAVQDSIVTVQGSGRSTSSGVVWGPGVVVTTRQGLRRGDSLQLALGGEPVPAKLAGTDAGTDIAVLRVDAGFGQPAKTADLQSTRVGEVVLAVGRSALGDISASAGIIARLGGAWRTWRGGQMDTLVRPDVRLYIGQSGSALVDVERRVLGINSVALARNAVITIPSTTVHRVVEAILERGHVPRPFLGAAMQAVPVPEASRSHFGEGVDEALLVLHVEANAPAAAAGIQVGDLMLALDGHSVHNVHDVQHQLSGRKVGDPVAVAILRGGAKMDLSVLLADRG